MWLVFFDRVKYLGFVWAYYRVTAFTSGPQPRPGCDKLNHYGCYFPESLPEQFVIICGDQISVDLSTTNYVGRDNFNSSISLTNIDYFLILTRGIFTVRLILTFEWQTTQCKYV